MTVLSAVGPADPRRPTLAGRLVTLRAASPDDAATIGAILDEPGVGEWWRRSEWERVDEKDAATFAIVWVGPGKTAGGGRGCGDPAAGLVVGCIQYVEELDPDYHSASVDIFVSSTAQGRGVGADAMRTLIAWLVDVRGHHRITVDPAAANRRAIHVYEKLGFRPVGLLREYERVADGRWRDALLMELLAPAFVRA